MKDLTTANEKLKPHQVKRLEKRGLAQHEDGSFDFSDQAIAEALGVPLSILNQLKDLSIKYAPPLKYGVLGKGFRQVNSSGRKK